MPPATPPPLPNVDVTIPQWHALNRARRRLAVLRSAVGRVTTLAGAAAASIGLFASDYTGVSLLTDAVLTLAGVATLRLWKPQGHQKATATVMYVAPGASLAALLVGERWIPGINVVEAAALTVWTVGVWVARPAETARRMLAPPPLPAPSTELEPVEGEVVCDHPAALWWARTVAVKDGAGPDTALEDIERAGEKAMRAVIRSTVPGQPVPDISKKRLSALMDVPEEDIAIDPVPGRGTSVRLLKVGRPDEDRGPASVWANNIAPLAMPGTVLTSVRSGRPTDVTQNEEG